MVIAYVIDILIKSVLLLRNITGMDEALFETFSFLTPLVLSVFHSLNLTLLTSFTSS